MELVAIVTIIGVGVIVAALAAYLIIIAYSLYKVSFTLGTVLIGVRAIASQCEPLQEVIGSIATDVGAVEQTLGNLVSGTSQSDGDEDQGAQPDEPQEDAEESAEYIEYEEEWVEVERPRRRRRVRAQR